MATQEEIDKEDQELLAKCRAAKPGVEILLLRPDARVGAIVLRAPTAAEYSLYTRTILEPETKHAATPNLFVTTCLYPESGAVASLLERLPGLLHSPVVQKAISYLNGSSSEAVGKA